MRIIFFLACWKRPEITELCFMGLQRLMEHNPRVFKSSAFAVISETEMIPLCEKYGIEYLMHENIPVGTKKNAGIKEVLKKDFDYLIELGSDDLILDELLDQYYPFMLSGEHFFGCKQLVMVDAVSAACRNFFFDPDLVQGLGRCFSKELLQSFSGRCLVKSDVAIFTDEFLVNENVEGVLDNENANLFESKGLLKILERDVYHLWDAINRGLDNNSTGRIMRAGYKFKLVETPEPLMADIKSDENIWGYNPEIGDSFNFEENFLSKVSQQERAKFFANMKALRAKRIETAA